MIVGNNSSAQAIRMLQELQAMASASRNEPVSPAGEQNFAGALKSAVDQVNTLQKTASAKTDAFTSGEDIPLTEVMVAMQKSRVAFEATKQVRNQLAEAYQAIFNMPV